MSPAPPTLCPCSLSPQLVSPLLLPSSRPRISRYHGNVWWCPRVSFPIRPCSVSVTVCKGRKGRGDRVTFGCCGGSGWKFPSAPLVQPSLPWPVWGCSEQCRSGSLLLSGSQELETDTQAAPGAPDSRRGWVLGRPRSKSRSSSPRSGAWCMQPLTPSIQPPLHPASRPPSWWGHSRSMFQLHEGEGVISKPFGVDFTTSGQGASDREVSPFPGWCGQDC